jgi:hypothetical protein
MSASTAKRVMSNPLPANWQSLGEIWDRLNDRRGRPAPQSTIDAVAYSLRGGASHLTRDDVRRRLAVIAENQLHEMIALLQKRDGRIAPPWSDDDIKELIKTWTVVHVE